ncbi:MAG: hypothetical protein RL217_88 [Pseudomonadota bacterium]
MRFFSLLLCLSFSLGAHAVTISDLYEVQVPVSNQQADSRKNALGEALQQVIVKVTGNSNALQNPDIQAQAQQAERYIKSLRYSQNPIDNSLQLDVIFAQDLLDKLLQRYQLAIWGQSRPLILLWQNIDEKGQRKLLSQENGRWQGLIEQAFDERGLPVLWPMLNTDDWKIQTRNGQGELSRDDIIEASERYVADAQMTGRLWQRADGRFQYQGFLLHQNQQLDLSANGIDAISTLRQIADQLAGYLSKQYAVKSTGQAAGVQITVAGVKNFTAYQELLSYLKANAAIKQVRVISAQEQSLTLELDLSTPWTQVWSGLVLDKRLRALEQEQSYQWQS